MRKAGLKFGQEVPVKGFTVDFLLDEWLVVEVDGESHLVSGRAEKDASRQRILEEAGFTVLRVPARELSGDSGLRRWVNRIREKVEAGPSYVKRQSFSNEDYKRQLEEVRKALRAGEIERERRQALALQRSGGRPGGTRASHDEETMEDYFGKKGQDFDAMLKGYDWSKVPEKGEVEDRPQLPRAATPRRPPHPPRRPR